MVDVTMLERTRNKPAPDDDASRVSQSVRQTNESFM
jgi:hypothetical protein